MSTINTECIKVSLKDDKEWSCGCEQCEKEEVKDIK